MTFDELGQAIFDTEYQGLGTAVKSLQKYLNAGGDINELDGISGWGLLHMAAEHQDGPLVAEMARLGADMNLHHPEGDPPIFDALDSDIDGARQCGTPLEFAMTIQFLLGGARTDTKDRDGLHFLEVVRSYGADVEAAFITALREFTSDEQDEAK